MASETAGPDASFAELLEDSAEDLYEHAPCGYLSTLLDGRVVKVNQTFLAWTGFTRDELVGRARFQDLLAPGGEIYYETHYAPMLQMQGQAREIALELVCADRTRLPVIVNSAVRRDAGGAPQLIRITVFDARERRSYEHELLLARRRAEESEARSRLLAETLQSSLIPPVPPAIPGLDLGAVYRPAGAGDEVGGDFYDVFEVAEGDWAIVLGDVEGKGAEAATMTALARYTLRAASMRTPEPAAALAMLNDALTRQRSERFCSALYVRVRIGDGGAELALASAGHSLPLLRRGDDVRAVGTPGHLLGLWEDFDLDEDTISLRTADVVVLYTDGVTEARRGQEWFGPERLEDLVRSERGDDAGTMAHHIVDEVVSFQEGMPRDDIAVVVIRVP